MNRWYFIRLLAIIIVQSSMILVPICHSTNLQSSYLVNQGVDHNTSLKMDQENTSVDITPPIVSNPVDIIILVNTTDHNITWYIADKNPRNYSIQHNYQQIESELNKTWSENQSVIFPLNNLMIGIHLFTIIVEDTWNNSAVDDVIVMVREVAYVPTFDNPTDNPNLADPFTLFLIIIIGLLIMLSILLRTSKSRKRDAIYSNLPPEDPLDLETYDDEF